VNLGRVEQQVLVTALDELRVMLANHDPATRRLFPTAYIDHPELDAEYQRLVSDELMEGQVEALDLVERTVDGEVIDRSELEGWMRAINGTRLAIGTRLDIGEEPVEIAPDDPDLSMHLIYDFLTQLLAVLIDTLSQE
jgi:hypothetical protein